MLIGKLLALSFALQVALHPAQPYIATDAEFTAYSHAREKTLHCITAVVAEDHSKIQLTDKITQAMYLCAALANAMLAAYERLQISPNTDSFNKFYRDLEHEIPERLRAAGH